MSAYLLSEKDKKIISALSMQGRISLTALSKQVNLSKQATKYRLDKLEQDKIITGYHCITNAYQMGLTHYRVFIKYQNTSSNQEKEILEYLTKNDNIVWLAALEGDYDLAFLIWAKNIREFEKNYREIVEKFGRFIHKKVFSISTMIKYLPYNYIYPSANKSIVFGDCFESIVLDQLDSQIMDELNKNGRATLLHMANLFGKSAKVIRDHMQSLQKKNILLGYNVKIDHTKLGYTHYRTQFKLSNPTTTTIRKIFSYLQYIKNVIYLVRTIGEYDIEMDVMCKTGNEYRNILDKFKNQFSSEVQFYSTSIDYVEPKSGVSRFV